MLFKPIISAFAASAAMLWVTLIPIWDGFDEAQHYSYIQSLRINRALPILGETPIAPEVWSSLLGSPVSASVKMNYPMLRTFDDVRQKRPSPASPPEAPQNYEAHQAPLVYLALVPLEGWLLRAGIPIGWRVRLLRMCLLACSMALFWRIAAIGAHRCAAFFTVITTEMFLASCGHVANDALAIPLFAWLFFEAERRSRLAVILFMGALLTKAYFLALVPIVAWRLRERWRLFLALGILPAVWYGPNLWMYGNLSGMQEQTSPLSTVDLLHAAIRVPWLASLGETLRGALWLANNSFLQWSVWQVNLVIFGLLAAVCWCLRSNRPRRNWLLAYSGCYLAALAYAAVQTFVYTNGVGIAASPWYATPFWLLLILIIFAGETPGWILISLVAVWTYWYVATLWFRLIPWYAGTLDGPANVANLSRWYRSSLVQTRHEIGDPVLVLALATSALAIAAAIVVCRDVLITAPRTSRNRSLPSSP